MFDPLQISRAKVLVNGVPAAQLERTPSGVRFSYLEGYTGPPVATTLPVTTEPVDTLAGALPPFFTGLLPEGRRFSALKRYYKVSADDEFSLLIAVGSDPVGNVQILPEGKHDCVPDPVIHWGDQPVNFGEILQSSHIPDPFAIAGVQPKASARVLTLPARLRKGKKEVSALLKVSPPEFPFLVENEHVCLSRLRVAGMKLPVVDSEIVYDEQGRSGLLVYRFDREEDRRFRVEDAAQLLGIYPHAKYAVSYEEVAHAIAHVCASPILALRSVAYQIAVAWLSGNGDLHAKNFSVIDRGDGFQVAPLYDVPITTPYGDSTLALSIGGKKEGLSKKRFTQFCAEIGLGLNVADLITHYALKATADLPDHLDRLCAFDPRRKRDVRRIFLAHRKHWE